MHLRKLLAAAGLVAALTFLAAPASATTPTPGNAVPGAPCSPVGAVGAHNGQTYRCEQRPNDGCPRWHWVYVPGPVRSWPPRSPQPCPSGCSSPTPTPSPHVTPHVTPTPTPHSVSPSPKRSTAPVAHHTTLGYGGGKTRSAQTLPVTGPGTVILAGTGAVLLGAGGVLLWWSRRRRSA